MRIKLTAWTIFALFCGSFAYATPILYIFSNNSGFTLDGVSYPGTYLYDPGPRLTLTLYADTDNVVTSGDFYTDTPGSQFIANRSAVGVVSYGGLMLATITDPVEFVIDTEGDTSYLVDGANQDIYLSADTRSYDGVSDFGPSNTLVYPTPLGFNTSVGELTITDSRSESYFQASLSQTSPVPEPASVIFLGTGALGFLGLFRRRLTES